MIPAGAGASCAVATTGPQLRLITYPASHRGTPVIPSGRCLFSPSGLLKLVINQLRNEVRLL